MTSYPVILNGKFSQVSLDPEQPLEAQLRATLRLPRETNISIKVQENDEFDILDPYVTLKKLGIAPGTTLYVSVPQSSIPPVLVALFIGLIVLFIGLIILLTPLGKTFQNAFFSSRAQATAITEGANTVSTTPPEATVASSAPTTSVSSNTTPSTTTAASTNTVPSGPTTVSGTVAPPPMTITPSSTATTTADVAIPEDPNLIEIAIAMPLLRDIYIRKATDIISSATLALSNTQELLKVPNLTIKLHVYKDDTTPALANHIAHQIADNNPNVLCVVGHYTSNASIAAKSVYQLNNISMITPSSTAKDVTDRQGGVVWRLVGIDSDQGTYGAKFAAEDLQGITKTLVIYDINLRNATQAATAFANQFNSYPGHNLLEDPLTYNSQNTTHINFQDKIDRIRFWIKEGLKPNLIYFAGTVDNAKDFMKALEDNKIADIPILGIDTFDTPELLNPSPPSIKVYATTMAQPLDNGNGLEFARLFAKSFNILDERIPDISSYTAEAYDATTLCVQAIANAANEKQGKPKRDDVLKQMQILTSNEIPSLSSIQGFQVQRYAGPYTFVQPGQIDLTDQKRPGNLAKAAFFVREIVDGHLKTTRKWDRSTERWVRLVQ